MYLNKDHNKNCVFMVHLTGGEEKEGTSKREGTEGRVKCLNIGVKWSF